MEHETRQDAHSKTVIDGSRKHAKTSPKRDPQSTEGDEDETPGTLEVSTIQERGSSLDQGYEPTDPVPIKEAWTKAVLSVT